MYNNRTFELDDKFSIKCRILSGGLYQYQADGLCHEDVTIIIDKELRDESGLELEKNTWYNVTGTVENIEDSSLQIKITDESGIDKIGTKVNDWIYNEMGNSRNRTMGGSGGSTHTRTHSPSNFNGMKDASLTTAVDTNAVSSESLESQSIDGFAAGGAKDINNFRQNIESGHLPDPNSLTYEGLFYEYEFDIAGRSKDSMFYPTYEHSYVTDPVTDRSEHYLALGLQSGIDEFNRPPLDLMLVLDISGSMNRSMSRHRSDSSSFKSDDTNKIQATVDVVERVLDRLRKNDRVGIVLYNDSGFIGKPIRDVDHTDMDAIKNEIKNIRAGGGTNLSDGFERSVEEFKRSDVDTTRTDRESRIMFFTDAMPNVGETDTNRLTDRMSSVAEEDGIHTTFIGIGIDADPEFINHISGIKGSNHYFADDVDEFKEQVGEEFVLMTVPLVYNLELVLEGDDYSIDEVYGNPTDDNNCVMRTETLFPSTGEDGSNGGVILVKLDDVKEDSDVRISATWTDRQGERHSDVRTAEIDDRDENTYDSEDMRKAVTLQKYVEYVSRWLEDTDAGSQDEWIETNELLDHLRSVKHFMEDNRQYIDDDISEHIRTIDTIIDA